MTNDSTRIKLPTDEQIAHLRTLSPDEKWRISSEINRRVKAEMDKVVRSEVPYFTEQQVHDAVCAMLLTKANPKCIDVRSIELEVGYGVTPDRPVSRPESWIAEQVAAGEAGPT